jgi:hypothetical protein
MENICSGRGAKHDAAGVLKSVPTGRALDWTSSYGTMFPIMSFGVWTARTSLLTGMDKAQKITSVLTANFAIIFPSLSDTHGLER